MCAKASWRQPGLYGGRGAGGGGGQQPPHLLRERVKCGDRESYSQEVV